MSSLTEHPHIPLEVAEKIIDLLRRDVRLLRSCALICRGWHPRARYHLMTSIRVQSRDELFSICDYFKSNPHLASLVRSLSVAPVEAGSLSLLEVVPVRLVSRLPNLHRYVMRNSSTSALDIKSSGVRLTIHRSTIIQIKTYLHVDALSLGPLEFRAISELARFLIALPSLRRFECTRLRVVNQGDFGTGPTGLTQFRDRCKMLSDVTVCRTSKWLHCKTDFLYQIRETDIYPVCLVTEMCSSRLEALRYDLGPARISPRGMRCLATGVRGLPLTINGAPLQMGSLTSQS